MKKKLTAVALVVCMLAVMLVGASLAYFTDKDQVNNTFTVGNVSIDLYEKTDAWQGMTFQKNLDYSHIMPGDELSKEPYIKNDGDEAAYVRVFVKINNHQKRNEAIDVAYEKQGKSQTEIQKIYNTIFDGWGINNTKVTDGIDGYKNVKRGSMAQREVTTNGVELYNIDSARNPAVTDGYQWEAWNAFQTTAEKANGYYNMGWDDNGYYMSALGEASDSNLYVFYLKLEPGKEYKLFDGLNVPADFTGDQLTMFQGLKIDIYADAIQAANFEDTTGEDGTVTETAWHKAFTALEEACPMGWWNAAE